MRKRPHYHDYTYNASTTQKTTTKTAKNGSKSLYQNPVKLINKFSTSVSNNHHDPNRENERGEVEVGVGGTLEE